MFRSRAAGVTSDPPAMSNTKSLICVLFVACSSNGGSTSSVPVSAATPGNAKWIEARACTARLDLPDQSTQRIVITARATYGRSTPPDYVVQSAMAEIGTRLPVLTSLEDRPPSGAIGATIAPNGSVVRLEIDSAGPYAPLDSALLTAVRNAEQTSTLYSVGLKA